MMRTIALALVVDVLVTTPCISDMPVGYFGNAGLMSGQGINTATLDGNPVLSSDGLALYFTSDRDSGGQGIADIFRATRETENAPFGNVERLGGGVNTPFQEIPSFVETSVDGITTLWFTSDRPNGYGGRDLYSATMQPGEDTFGNVQNMGETVNTQYEDRTAFFSSDRLSFYFYSNRPGTEGQFDIYRSVRPSLDAPFDTPIRLSGPINGPGWDGGNISLSSDELYLFFYSNSPRPRNDFALDIWIAARSSVESEFDTAMNLNDFSLGSAVNVDGDIEATPHVSRDWPANGSKLYYLTIQRNNNPGFLDWNVWEATWTQVDVSSNGVLDVTDIDDLALAIREESDERRFDLNHDGQVDGFD
ncbi:MAG: PD40 domain-containing protein [Planctomycetales bacterium]|nr:PD40 domain-containing protein [Planctomycetales bacterium]